MSTLLLSYNPLAVRVVLVFAVILLVLGILLYQIHVRSSRRRQARHPAHVPEPASAPQESGTIHAPEHAPASAPQEAGTEMFRESVRPSSPILRDFGRLALILLA